MSKKIGHDYNRDPYPWDTAKKGGAAAQWSCCEMNLPATFSICPICEKERVSVAGGSLSEESEES